MELRKTTSSQLFPWKRKLYFTSKVAMGENWWKYYVMLRLQPESVYKCKRNVVCLYKLLLFPLHVKTIFMKNLYSIIKESNTKWLKFSTASKVWYSTSSLCNDTWVINNGIYRKPVTIGKILCFLPNNSPLKISKNR